MYEFWKIKSTKKYTFSWLTWLWITSWAASSIQNTVKESSTCSWPLHKKVGACLKLLTPLAVQMVICLPPQWSSNWERSRDWLWTLPQWLSVDKSAVQGLALWMVLEEGFVVSCWNWDHLYLNGLSAGLYIYGEEGNWQKTKTIWEPQPECQPSYPIQMCPHQQRECW